MKLFRQKLLFIVFLIVCFSLPESSFGQQPLTRKISFLEGLNSDVVYDLFVDKDGLLYLGTDKGLMTFDWVHFDPISVPESLGNSVSSIQQDEACTIWFKKCANQMFCLKNNHLMVDKNVKKLLEKPNASLIDFSVGTNEIYILTQKVIYSYVSGKIKPIFNIQNNANEVFNSIVYDRKNKKLYVSSSHSLFVFQNDVFVKRKRLSKDQKVLEIFKGQLVYSAKSLGEDCFIGNQIIPL